MLLQPENRVCFRTPDVFERIVDARRKSPAATKYQMELDDGWHNQGEFRDNLWDILEELSDARVIADIGFGRLIEATWGQHRLDLVTEYLELYECLNLAAAQAVVLRRKLPSELAEDHIDIGVERHYYEGQDELPWG